MRYIGNIVTKSKIEVNEFFLVTKDFSQIDKSVPTLIVGWSLVQELFPDQDILSSKIEENISWTFSKREKRYRFEEDIEDYVKKCIKNMGENVNYKFFNYLTASPEKRKNFVAFVNRGNCYIYHNTKFLYLYNPLSKMTIGLSLMDLQYVGINTKHFLSMLDVDGTNFFISNFDFIGENALILIKDNIKAVPYLNYLKNSNIY